MATIDRSNYTLETALREIALAEAILDGLGAAEGHTLWGRVKSVKDANDALTARVAELEAELGNLVEWLTDNQSTIEGEFDMDELLESARALLKK